MTGAGNLFRRDPIHYKEPFRVRGSRVKEE